MRGIPVGRQFASGSSFDCRLSMIAFAAGSSGIVSPGASPCARSPTGPPPFHTPDRSGCPSARRGVGPCGVTSRGRALGVSGFALPPAGAVTWPGVREDFVAAVAGAGAGACATAPTVNRDAIARAVRLDFTVVLLRLLSRSRVGRRAGKDLLAVGQHYASGISHLRSVLGLGAFHRDLIAHAQRVSCPSLSNQHVWTRKLQIP